MNKLTAVLALALYLGMAVANVPRETKYEWEVSHQEFIQGTPAQKENTVHRLTDKDYGFQFPKSGWGCVITKKAPDRELSFQHEMYQVGCTHDGESMVVVTHFCTDVISPMSTVILSSRKSQYQARVFVSCKQVAK